jgi:hypothetical protein
MGSPTSAVLAETFIQYLEHTKIIKILNKHPIIDYHRYVDDRLIIYNTDTTHIENTFMNCDSSYVNFPSSKAEQVSAREIGLDLYSADVGF